jgi:hypothetical protein
MNTFLCNLENNRWASKDAIVNENSFIKTNLVLCFGQKSFFGNKEVYTNTKKQFPNAEIVFCSTSGEICNNNVTDKDGILVALEFEKTKLHTVSVNIANYNNSYDAAVALINSLPHNDLSYVMVISDGSLINGSELVRGLNDAAPKNVKISGGLAGDGPNFTSTLVGLNNHATNGEIVAIGFYGNAIKIENGSQGGWQPFGLEKRVTKSKNNVLFELENENALDVYKKYLGKEADKLPGAAIVFPLSIMLPNTDQPVVRTILSINEDEKSMTFAGDLPEGSKVRFMRSNLEKLTEAAAEAAKNSTSSTTIKPSFSLLVSCVGRKIVMGNNAVDEVTAVINQLGKETKVAGFYSYGEIAPFSEGGNCQLHNQTMTITSFYESL